MGGVCEKSSDEVVERSNARDVTIELARTVFRQFRQGVESALWVRMALSAVTNNRKQGNRPSSISKLIAAPGPLTHLLFIRIHTIHSPHQPLQSLRPAPVGLHHQYIHNHTPHRLSHTLTSIPHPIQYNTLDIIQSDGVDCAV